MSSPFLDDLARAQREGATYITHDFSYVIRVRVGITEGRLLEKQEWTPCCVGVQKSDRALESVVAEAQEQSKRQESLPLDPPAPQPEPSDAPRLLPLVDAPKCFSCEGTMLSDAFDVLRCVKCGGTVRA